MATFIDLTGTEELRGTVRVNVDNVTWMSRVKPHASEVTRIFFVGVANPMPDHRGDIMVHIDVAETLDEIAHKVNLAKQGR